MDAFYLDAVNGQRLCVLHMPPPGVPLRGAFVYIHPFAEEMNRCRRMASVQARALSRAGVAVLQMDLWGCGDSAGDFSDATWSAWRDDVVLARQWLRTRTGQPVGLWGVRAGCLLAAEVASQVKEDSPQEPLTLLMWQPVLSGKQHLQQFLRLKLAGHVVQGAPAGSVRSTEVWLRQLDAGQPVEVAGYLVAPALAAGLQQATLEGLGAPVRVACCEVVGGAQESGAPATGLALSPGLQAQMARWQAAGVDVQARVVGGPAFWQFPEAGECPALVEATMELVERLHLGGQP